MSTKFKAQSQFDSSAKPISLGCFFQKSFVDYEFNIDDVDDSDDEDVSEDIDCITEMPVDNLDLDPVQIALLANDIDPQIRDRQEESSQEFSPDDFITAFDTLEEIGKPMEKPVPVFKEQYDVNSVRFQLEKSDFRDRMKQFDGRCKPVVAINLLSNAITRLKTDQRKDFGIDKMQQDPRNKLLIDKSQQSIDYIHQIAKKIITIINQRKDYGIDPGASRSNDRLFLNKFKPRTKLDRLLGFSIIAKYILYSHIELNCVPAKDLIAKENFLFQPCHKVLSYLNFATKDFHHSNQLPIMSLFVHNFPIVTGSKRLFYLENLLRKWKDDMLFFQSNSLNFNDDQKHLWRNRNYESSVIIVE